MVGRTSPVPPLALMPSTENVFPRPLLLFENQERLVESGAAFFDFLPEPLDLGVLTAEAENGGAGDIGVGDVPGKEAAKGPGVIAGATAPLSVLEELHAVDILE